MLHEAGHAVAGVTRGIQAIAFGVGPRRVERGPTGRWRWRWRWRYGGGIGGFAALVVRGRVLVSAWRGRCEGGLMDLSPYRAWLDAETAGLDGDPAAVAGHIGRARGLADRIPDAASRRVFDARLDALL